MALLGNTLRSGGRGARKGASALPVVTTAKTVQRFVTSRRGGPPPRALGIAAGGAVLVGGIAFLRRRSAAARQATDRAVGAVSSGTPSPREPASERLNDAALARKVESEIFRADDAPKGSVSVNAEEGIVVLRGEVRTPEQIMALGEAAKKVDGVRGVENLLHLPDAPPAQRGEDESARRTEGAKT